MPNLVKYQPKKLERAVYKEQTWRSYMELYKRVFNDRKVHRIIAISFVMSYLFGAIAGFGLVGTFLFGSGLGLLSSTISYSIAKNSFWKKANK
jgi:hypothetical protein